MNFREQVELKKLIFISFFFIAFGTFAQQGLQMDFIEPDSMELKLERQLEYQLLISGLSGFLDGELELPKINFQDFNFTPNIVNFDFNPSAFNSFSGYSPGMWNSFSTPFFRNGKIISAAAYRLNDKFTLGGFSYGANSIHTAPLPNQGMNKFVNYGSTLFMEYKVSKNFKIETRVNVQQGGYPPGF